MECVLRIIFGKFGNNNSERNEQVLDNKHNELHSKGECFFNEEEIDYLVKNTTYTDEISISGDATDYTDDELKELYDDFAGYTNGEVRYENSGKSVEDSSLPREYGDEYKQTGIHKVSWSKDSIDGTEQEITIPMGTRIIQYSHEGSTCRYFANGNTDYSDLQLADSQDKRVLSIYEVVKDLLVT